jgi:hypothetical protein
MMHFASRRFWDCYDALPESIRNLADKNFELLKENSGHPGLHFKRVGKYWSACVGRNYRTLAVEVDDGLLWFWIGTHADYDQLLGR